MGMTRRAAFLPLDRAGSMAWIRSQYGVPAKRGGRVVCNGRPGVIIAARSGYIRVRGDDGQVASWHPTWRIEYLPAVQEWPSATPSDASHLESYADARQRLLAAPSPLAASPEVSA